MRNPIKTVPVTDSNGDQLTLYVIHESVSWFGLVVKKRLVLGTGEIVGRERDHYVVISTGEKLMPVEPSD